MKCVRARSVSAERIIYSKDKNVGFSSFISTLIK